MKASITNNRVKVIIFLIFGSPFFIDAFVFLASPNKVQWPPKYHCLHSTKLDNDLN